MKRFFYAVVMAAALTAVAWGQSASSRKAPSVDGPESRFQQQLLEKLCEKCGVDSPDALMGEVTDNLSDLLDLGLGALKGLVGDLTDESGSESAPSSAPKPVSKGRKPLSAAPSVSVPVTPAVPAVPAPAVSAVPAAPSPQNYQTTKDYAASSASSAPECRDGHCPLSPNDAPYSLWEMELNNQLVTVAGFTSEAQFADGLSLFLQESAELDDDDIDDLELKLKRLSYKIADDSDSRSLIDFMKKEKLMLCCSYNFNDPWLQVRVFLLKYDKLYSKKAVIIL